MLPLRSLAVPGLGGPVGVSERGGHGKPKTGCRRLSRILPQVDGSNLHVEILASSSLVGAAHRVARHSTVGDAVHPL